MENPTPLSLDEAIRRWRAEFGSPSSLSAAELEELEAHLRDHVAQLEATGMKPEAAFAVAAKQLGDRQRVAGEFAKINPQRVWLERAIWMAVGVFLFSVFGRLTALPETIIFNHSVAMRLDPAVCVTLRWLGGLTSMALLTALLRFTLSRRPDWGRALVGSCERSLLATGIAVALMLWGCLRLQYFYDYILSQRAPWLHAWLFPAIRIPAADEAVMNMAVVFCGMAEGVIWSVALCVLAARVVRRKRLSLPAAGMRGMSAPSNWLERLLWMVAGWVVIRCGAPFLHECVMIPASWMVPALGESAVLQHLAGLITAALALVLWAFPVWAFWLFGTRYPRFDDLWRRAFRYHPVWTSLGVSLLLNIHVVLFPIIAWTGMQAGIAVVGGPSPIVAEWNYGPWMVLCHRVVIAAMLIMLVRWRMKLCGTGQSRTDAVSRA